ncbi:ABC transporter permease [Yinghuangia soli]|uniref:ABC transporter permease n=1 Tax=Yinghuangia soli TaxID=2908204 RepID=A0AA41Q068_9ACTN|nr:ABC transporter permease [Yinghuangia soli]MCF2528009.1 ABC transporter permease [Yinghuangia soli]
MSTDINAGTYTDSGTRGQTGFRQSAEAVFDPAGAPAAPSGRVLTLVELRKMTDTRSGRWLMAVIVAAMFGMVCLVVFAGEKGDRTTPELFLASQTGMSLLLPVVAILSVTAEWSQRSGLTTFALVPRRSRVIQAKLQAGLILSAVFVALSAVVAWGGHALALATGNADGGWGIPPALAGTRLLDCAVSIVTGIGFGMLLTSPILAILALYAVPLVLGILGSTVAALDGTMEWLNPGQALSPLSEDAGISATEWVRIALNCGMFAVLPFTGGLLALRHREFK